MNEWSPSPFSWPFETRYHFSLFTFHGELPNISASSKAGFVELRKPAMRYTMVNRKPKSSLLIVELFTRVHYGKASTIYYGTLGFKAQILNNSGLHIILVTSELHLPRPGSPVEGSNAARAVGRAPKGPDPEEPGKELPSPEAGILSRSQICVTCVDHPHIIHTFADGFKLIYSSIKRVKGSVVLTRYTSEDSDLMKVY